MFPRKRGRKYSLAFRSCKTGPLCPCRILRETTELIVSNKKFTGRKMTALCVEIMANKDQLPPLSDLICFNNFGDFLDVVIKEVSSLTIALAGFMAVEWLRFDVTLSMSVRENSASLKEKPDVDNYAAEFQSFDFGFGCYLEELKNYKI